LNATKSSPVKALDVIHGSVLYRSGARLRRWGRHSLFVSLATNSEVQLAVIALVLLSSLFNVFRSNANAAVKFLSFALLAVLTLVVTWSLTDPLAE